MAVEYVTHLEKTHEVVPVTLASGEVKTCTRKIGPKGMPTINMIAKHKNNILPLLWLIERHCELSSDWRTLITPRRRHLPIIIDGELPYLNEDGVKTLMEDLPESHEPGRSGTRAEMQINLVAPEPSLIAPPRKQVSTMRPVLPQRPPIQGAC